MLRTLIVDDEAPARARLRRMLKPYEESGKLSLAGEAGDGVEALEWLGQNHADLLLLDIQMPGLSGFDVLDRMPPGLRPAVVFVTAYDQYALQAFDAAAVDYLLKPVAEERLSAALDRVGRMTGPGSDIDERLGSLLEYLDRLPSRNETGQREEPLRQLSIPVADRIAIVPVEQLIAAEIDEGLTRLFVLNNDDEHGRRLHRHTVSYPLDTLERRLDGDLFMRVHRSAIVQVTHIREMIPWFSGRFKLVLTGGHEVIASRARSKDLRERLVL